MSVVVALFGLAFAWARWGRGESWPQRIADSVKGLEPAVEHKWYVDSAYNAWIVLPLRRLSEWFASVFDQKIIDGAVNGIASGSLRLGERVRYLETGAIPNYALSILLGAVVLVIIFVVQA